ncbi:MAG: NAD-binding protein [Actinomycetia bacterium]|nr:NAD-binding protein [Actinomycetes bacterium]
MTDRTAPPSLRRRFSFWFERMMARGAGPLIALLALVTLLLIIFCAVVVIIGGIQNPDGSRGFIEAGWSSLMRTFDPGTMGGDSGWSLRGVSLIATLGGLFIVSALIGVITTGLDGRLQDLRRGRGAVALSGHTLILGWSSAVEAIITELAEANSNQRKSAVVVLADFPKEAMDDALATASKINKGMITVTRTGETANIENLRAVGVETAKSVIVVSSEQSEDADPDAVRTSLAVLNATNFKGHVVVELKRHTLAETLRAVSNGRALAVTGPHVIAQVTAEVCRYHGMSEVYQDLFDFDGDEIYFHREPGLVGRSFGDAVQSFETSSILGIRAADGAIRLAPAVDTVIADGDLLIAISEDDDTIVLAPGTKPAAIKSEKWRETTTATPILLLGWNHLALPLLAQLDRRLPEGSQIMVCDTEPPDASLQLKRCKLQVLQGDPQDHHTLQKLVHERAYHTIAVLSGRARSVADDDSRNLLTLLSLRQILDEPNCPSADAFILTELRNAANVQIAGGSDSDNFIVSDRLVAQLMSQLSENSELMSVFNSLFDATQVELSVVPLDRLGIGAACTVRDVVVAGLARGMLVLGMVVDSKVIVNAAKSLPVSDPTAAAAIVLRQP